MKVKVKKEDILQGRCGSPGACALALAVKRVLNLEDLHTGDGWNEVEIHPDEYAYDTGEYRSVWVDLRGLYEILPTGKALDFIFEFDDIADVVHDIFEQRIKDDFWKKWEDVEFEISKRSER